MIVIAHRGSSQLAPENTLPAIEKAMLDGADAIEIDVQLTADQKVVVLHDEWLNRTTDGSGFVVQATSAQIKQLDAGSWFGESCKGTQVPFLEEVLELVKTSSVQLNIELKNNLIPYPSLPARVIRLIQEYKMEDQVIISSFRRNSLEECLFHDPSIRRGLLCWSTLQPLYQYKEWEGLQLYSIHPHISIISPQVSQLQEKGIRLFPFVVSKKKDLLRCIKLKVDGLFTDCPKRVKQLLKK